MATATITRRTTLDSQAVAELRLIVEAFDDSAPEAAEDRSSTA
jgi:hypothetical protein